MAVGSPRQQFFIENRAGASGNIGTEAVAKAPAELHTAAKGDPACDQCRALQQSQFRFIRDIAPVIARRLAYVVVGEIPRSPATTIPESSHRQKANPARSIRVGRPAPRPKTLLATLQDDGRRGLSTSRIGAARLRPRSGRRHLQVIFSPVSESDPAHQAGKLRALAVTPRPFDVLPDVPTMADFVPL